MAVASLVAGTVLFFSPVAKADSADFLNDFLNIGLDLQMGGSSFTVESSPMVYGQIPPHNDDLHVLYGPNHSAGTKEVVLEGANHGGLDYSFELDISPIPAPFLQNIQVGYRATFFDSISEETRNGLSNMEWYTHGARAGTYSRISIPSRQDSFILSLTLPIHFENGGIVLRGGISYDSWDTSIEGGWDRYHSEESMIKDDLKLKGENPFVNIGVYFRPNDFNSRRQKFKSINDGAIEFHIYYKQNDLNGSSPQGDVKLSGYSAGIGLRINM